MPDGGKLLTGGADKVVRLWNLASGAKERDFAGPTLPIVAVAVSSNGATVAAAAADKTLDTLERRRRQGAAQARACPPSASVLGLLLPTRQTIAGRPGRRLDPRLRFADGKEAKSLAGHKGPVVGLALAPKGDVLYSAGADKAIQAWSLPDGKTKGRLEHGAPVTALALSKDGTRLAAAAGKAMKVWTMADGKEIAAWTAAGEVRRLALRAGRHAPDPGRRRQAGARLRGGRQLRGILRRTRARSHAAAVRRREARRHGRRRQDGPALDLGPALAAAQHQGPVRQALFTPKGDQVVSRAGDDKTDPLWNAADGKEVRVLDQRGRAGHAARPERRRHAARRRRRTRRQGLDARRSGKAERSRPPRVCRRQSERWPLSPNGQRLAVASATASHAIRVIDVALGREVQAFADHTGAVRRWLPGRQPYAGDGAARQDGPPARRQRAQRWSGPSRAAWSSLQYAQQRHAACDRRARTRRSSSGTWPRAPCSSRSARWPSRSRRSPSARTTPRSAPRPARLVKVWNVADGKEIATLTHPGEVLSLAFSPDKARLATGAADKQTRLWELATGKELQFFPQADAVERRRCSRRPARWSAAGRQGGRGSRRRRSSAPSLPTLGRSTPLAWRRTTRTS